MCRAIQGWIVGSVLFKNQDDDVDDFNDQTEKNTKKKSKITMEEKKT